MPIMSSTDHKNLSVDLGSMRHSYKDDKDVLLESELPSTDPVQLFQYWFEDAKRCEKILEPNAVCLSTANKDGVPSSRMVLLKSFGTDGFKIFTNLTSRKGLELTENPHAALLFYWDAFNKQIRIEGDVTLLPEEVSREYFESRPKRSQIAAAISDQSSPIQDRDALIQKYKILEEKHANDPFVPKPKTWGGFNIRPHRFEFWVGQTSRLHDRIVFRRPSPKELEEGSSPSSWIMERLQP